MSYLNGKNATKDDCYVYFTLLFLNEIANTFMTNRGSLDFNDYIQEQMNTKDIVQHAIQTSEIKIHTRRYSDCDNLKVNFASVEAR